MADSRRSHRAQEFGDFQTPVSLAEGVTRVLITAGIRPRSIVEPTCGTGAFIAAAAAAFPDAVRFVGVDINAEHLRDARRLNESLGARLDLREADFYQTDWSQIVTAGGAPWLIIGNPPWVTSAVLGSMNSQNLPVKSNFQKHPGIAAITGKSNFDISEWMVLRYLDWLTTCAGTIAVLCKTTVARKILRHAWAEGLPVAAARIYRIDAAQHFDASVDACLFVLDITDEHRQTVLACDVFDSLASTSASRQIGFRSGHLVADLAKFDSCAHVLGNDGNYVWRSGVKHDCSPVMELSRESGQLKNGLGESVDVEDSMVFPMLKSSDVANGRNEPRNMMLVTQTQVGEDTSRIKASAPKTWQYLLGHETALARRASSIYRQRPPFSIFGVGPYTFAPWKIAVSGFYKDFRFRVVGPSNGRPVVFDDTVYFLPCRSGEEAKFVLEMLTSDVAMRAFRSMTFWDEKRPIRVEILRRVSVKALATAQGSLTEYEGYVSDKTSIAGEQARGHLVRSA